MVRSASAPQRSRRRSAGPGRERHHPDHAASPLSCCPPRQRRHTVQSVRHLTCSLSFKHLSIEPPSFQTFLSSAKPIAAPSAPALPSLPVKHHTILLTIILDCLHSTNTAFATQSVSQYTCHIHHGHTSALRLLLRDLECAF